MGKTILIVDDDRKFVKILEDALIPRGYRLITSYQGEQGLKLFKQSQPDLLLVDALLPKLDGFQLCDAIRKEPHGKTIPIIMMTAIYKMESKEREARTKYGVKAYLTKPIDLEKLLDHIEGCLN